jgi:hypothetical protein
MGHNNPYQPACSPRRCFKWLCSTRFLSFCSHRSSHVTTLASPRAYRAAVSSGPVFPTQPLAYYNNPYQPARASHRCSKRLCFFHVIPTPGLSSAPPESFDCHHRSIHHWLWLSIASPQPPRSKLAGFCRLYPALHFSFPRLFPLWNA